MRRRTQGGSTTIAVDDALVRDLRIRKTPEEVERRMRGNLIKTGGIEVFDKES